MILKVPTKSLSVLLSELECCLDRHLQCRPQHSSAASSQNDRIYFHCMAKNNDQISHCMLIRYKHKQALASRGEMHQREPLLRHPYQVVQARPPQ
jgi:hypothetical protein